MKLYSLPFAGGGAHVYRDLAAELDGELDVVGVELPGRGRRFAEPALTDLEALARDVVDRLGSPEAPFALLGHSMGATLAYLVARALAARRRPAPCFLCVSGQRAPFLERRRAPLYRLSDPEFRAALRALGGCPPGFLEEPELLELFLPVLRADFQALETFAPLPEAVPGDIPILALAGADDDSPRPDEVAPWRAMTRGTFEFHEVPGDHFFIAKNPGSVADRIRGFAARVVPS